MLEKMIRCVMQPLGRFAAHHQRGKQQHQPHQRTWKRQAQQTDQNLAQHLHNKKNGNGIQDRHGQTFKNNVNGVKSGTLTRAGAGYT